MKDKVEMKSKYSNSNNDNVRFEKEHSIFHLVPSWSGGHYQKVHVELI